METRPPEQWRQPVRHWVEDGYFEGILRDEREVIETITKFPSKMAQRKSVSLMKDSCFTDEEKKVRSDELSLLSQGDDPAYQTNNMLRTIKDCKYSSVIVCQSVMLNSSGHCYNCIVSVRSQPQGQTSHEGESAPKGHIEVGC